MTKKAAKKAAKAVKPKAPKKPRGTKAAPQATGSVAGDNVVKMDPKQRELARHHRDEYIKRKEAQNKANRNMQALGKTIKADGLTVRQIKLMVDLMTPEGEAAFRANVAGDLMAAQWQGAAIGTQLSLFMQPDRTPSAELAYDLGVQDSIDGKTAKAPYDPSTEQARQYLKGYHDETARRVKDGIKPTEPKDDKPRAEVLQAARDKNAAQVEADKFH